MKGQETRVTKGTYVRLTQQERKKRFVPNNPKKGLAPSGIVEKGNVNHDALLPIKGTTIVVEK